MAETNDRFMKFIPSLGDSIYTGKGQSGTSAYHNDYTLDWARKTPPPRVVEIRQCIEESFKNPTKVRELCESINLSVKHWETITGVHHIPRPPRYNAKSNAYQWSELVTIVNNQTKTKYHVD